ncbi:hypothetical protein Bca4012_006414 [Brassica carinata]
MEDAIAAASATIEATAAKDRSSGGCGGYGGGGYGDGKREGRYKRLVDTMVVDVVIRKVELVVVMDTMEVAVDTGVEVVVVMDTKVVVDSEVDTFGNFVDETSFTNLIHTISSMELY